MNSLRLTALALVVAATLTACSSGEPEDRNPEELITEVTITLTNENDSTDRVEIVASDADGDGRDITFSPASVALRAGAPYLGEIRLRDTVNGENITEEVEAEAEEHLFRYGFSPLSAGAAAPADRESDYTPADENGGDFAVGLEFQVNVATSASGSGTLDVLLYHFDDSPKTSNTDTSDEIDIDIAFPVTFVAPPAARQ